MPAKTKKPLKWDGETTAEWLAEVESWQWKYDETEGQWVKSGTCPRCKHYMSRRVGQVLTIKGVLSPSEPVDIACNCDESHPSRPDDKVGGCGPSGLFSGPKLEDGEI